jgi:DNA gyrase subunit A
MSSELEATVEEESRAQWAQKNEDFRKDNTSEDLDSDEDVTEDDVNDDEPPPS